MRLYCASHDALGAPPLGWEPPGREGRRSDTRRATPYPEPSSLEHSVSKRTFQPNNRRRAKTHGFRLRMRTRAGRAIVNNRRNKGRARLAA